MTAFLKFSRKIFEVKQQKVFQLGGKNNKRKRLNWGKVAAQPTKKGRK